jgi:prepilin-type N-terminal cleavage/methylation domain-containing protein/prepilin-type processing-associated H-X9-DG protein
MNRYKMSIKSNCKQFQANACRYAFTLVELLVVIAIMGVLIAMLLPAINAARESARKMQCSNNIKQMALACLSYQDTYQILPPASNFTSNTDNSKYLKEANVRANWIILVLPYVGQQALFNEINGMLKQSGINVESNSATSKMDSNITMKSCRETEIPSFLCPSDGNNRIKFESAKGSGFTGARCNYGANMGLDYAYNLYSGWSNNLKHGVMGPGKCMKTEEIIDGASNTIMLAELRAGVISIDCRGTWALGGAGPSSIAACGYMGDSKGPNSRNNAADDIYGCFKVEQIIDKDHLLILGMECSNSDSAEAHNGQATSRSLHPGGVQTAFCDGSVHWISDGISVGTSETDLGVWDKLLLPCDGFSVSTADF